jgi:hypothetical protein
VDEAGCGAAPGVRRSGQGGYPIGERLRRVRSTVRSGYGAGEGTWGVREPQTGVRGACHKLVCDNTLPTGATQKAGLLAEHL